MEKLEARHFTWFNKCRSHFWLIMTLKVRGSGRGLIWATIQASVRKEWEMSRKTSVNSDGLRLWNQNVLRMGTKIRRSVSWIDTSSSYTLLATKNDECRSRLWSLRHDMRIFVMRLNLYTRSANTVFQSLY
jgi:hypothetical protein